jgi:hypothetical protein
MNPLQILLRQSIDYAGLFPPAALDMPAAVANYAGYRTGPDAWALGRFVVPAARLDEFAAALSGIAGAPSPGGAWPLAALTGPDVAGELELIARFNHRASHARIDTVELKAGSAAAIHDSMHRMPRHLQAYIEIPVDRDPAALIGTLSESRARAKVRTGGVTRDAFPEPHDLIRFMATCIRARVPFKATAGLHHPLRAEYRLTYEADSDRGVMFGFLNLFLAAAFLRAGMDERSAMQVLEERSPRAFQVEDDGVSWRHSRLSPEELRSAREEVIVSFGSCSFTEPLTELQALSLLEGRVRQA